MKTFNYYEYSSKRFDRSAQAEQVRNFIFAFKDGKQWATDAAADMVVSSFVNTYGDKASDFVMVCAPAANSKKYTKRFSRFAQKVSQAQRYRTETSTFPSMESAQPSTSAQTECVRALTTEWHSIESTSAERKSSSSTTW